METAVLITFGFALGATVASFLNVVADRVPEGASLTHPPSRCPVDGHRLKPYELVPVFSYLLQRGRCRVCGAPIPFRVFAVELIGGVAFAAIAYGYGVSVDALLLATTLSFLLVIAVIDFEHQLILNKVLIVAIPVAVVTSMFWSESLRSPAWDVGPRQVNLLIDGLAAGLIAAAVWAVIFAIVQAVPYFGGKGLGLGDVKLALAIGPWVGMGGLLMTYYVGIVAGGIVGIILIIVRLISQRPVLKQVMAYGPFLCFGAAIGTVWGRNLMDWYLRVLGY